MEKSHIGADERLWIATEIRRLISIATEPNRPTSKWADNLVRNVYLWYWTADGINTEGEVQRDLFKRDPTFIRHTPEALTAITESRSVIHEHAVPRVVILRHLKKIHGASADDIKVFLDRFCFGVIIDKGQDQKLTQWKQDMPSDFSASSDPLERYKQAGIEVREPKYPRVG